VCYQLMLRSRSQVRAFLTSTVIAAAMVLAGCTLDGTLASIGNTGSIGSFVRNLFGSKSEDQAPVAHNDASVEPSAPKTKPATSKPKRRAVAAADAHRAKLRAPANKKTAIALVPKPSPKRQASAEPQSPSGSTTPPLLSGAAPTVPVGSFENRFAPSR
jgi:hypothetical protein